MLNKISVILSPLSLQLKNNKNFIHIRIEREKEDFAFDKDVSFVI